MEGIVEGTATKYDAGKPKLSLISPDVLRMLLPDSVPNELKDIVYRISSAAHSESEYTYQHNLQCAIIGLRGYLTPRTAIEGITQGLEYGLKKYHRNNWKGGMSFSRVLDAALRHLVFGHCMGECIDDESKNPHYAHALCMLMFAWEYQDMQELNDIYEVDKPAWEEEEDE